MKDSLYCRVLNVNSLILKQNKTQYPILHLVFDLVQVSGCFLISAAVHQSVSQSPLG